MDSSQFTDSSLRFDSFEQLNTRGATSDTYRVKLYGKLHFLKRLKPEYAGDIRYQEALHKEFETGFRLEHPNLVRYISLDHDSILMEYVDGESLSKRLDTQPDYFKNRKNADKFIRQLLDAVGYLHSHQVLHLDLKPDNIMLTRISNDVKLVDFGCCYSDTFADTTGRTNSYAAPEQLAGKLVDARTDIYTIGKIIAELPLRPYIYNKVASKCMASNPDGRYQTVDELQRALRSRRPTVISFAAFVSVLSIVGSVLLFKGCSPEAAPQRTDTPPTAVAATPIDTSLLATVTMPEPKENSPVTVKQEDQTSQMKKELEKMLDKAYSATIASFCDSVFPSPSVGIKWEDASEEFHRRVNQIGDKLVKKYPSIPETVIRQDLESRFQNLVGYVFGRMRENGEPEPVH
jgi:serine/threonine protein kinase